MATQKKKSTRSKTTTPAPADPRASKHDLDELSIELPHPGPEYRGVILGGESERALVELGQSYATEDILHATPAFVSAIVEQSPTAAQRELLLGYAPETVALLVHEAIALRGLNRAYDERNASASAEVRREALRVSMREGVALRDSTERLLDQVVPQSTKLRDALEAARGTAQTPSMLVQSLRGFADVIRRLRKQSSARAREILDGVRLRDALADRLDAMGDTIEAKEKLAIGGTGTRLSQRQLDYQDGVVLTLIASLWHAFNDAAQQSPTLVVPPLGRLRRLVGSHRAPVAPPETPPAEPAPPTQS